uniref:Uncharacterized protein n=1 Tax=Rhizophora mucronata TaxID=61149 RepID=A0A2P2NY39_RHIMU
MVFFLKLLPLDHIAINGQLRIMTDTKVGEKIIKITTKASLCHTKGPTHFIGLIQSSYQLFLLLKYLLF